MDGWIILFTILAIGTLIGHREKKKDDALLKLCGLEEKQKEVEELLKKSKHKKWWS